MDAVHGSPYAPTPLIFIHYGGLPPWKNTLQRYLVVCSMLICLHEIILEIVCNCDKVRKAAEQDTNPFYFLTYSVALQSL
jgi:hypothetical protein